MLRARTADMALIFVLGVYGCIKDEDFAHVVSAGTAWVGRLGAGYSYVPLRAATNATKTLKADLLPLKVIVPTTTTTPRNPSDKLTSTWASLRQMCRIDECPIMKPFRLLLRRQNPTQLTSALLFGMNVQHADQHWVYGGQSNV